MNKRTRLRLYSSARVLSKEIIRTQLARTKLESDLLRKGSIGKRFMNLAISVFSEMCEPEIVSSSELESVARLLQSLEDEPKVLREAFQWLKRAARAESKESILKSVKKISSVWTDRTWKSESSKMAAVFFFSGHYARN